MGRKIILEALSSAQIESSPEIQRWLAQFPTVNQVTAQAMLSHLRFVSRDAYSTWLRQALEQLPQRHTYALFSVRKTESSAQELWDANGKVIPRPGASLGSEDLVYSLISNATRSTPTRFFDHPGIDTLRDQRIRNIVLIDDSIGSGERVGEFLQKIFTNKSFLSWWSLGWVKIQILSFLRTHESEKVILSMVKGSEHPIRVHPKSSKIRFISKQVYSTEALSRRWGDYYINFIDLCDKQTAVAKWARRGYGKVMANVMFYHSVPNNTPGVFWFSSPRWQGLFPGRVIPDWLISLLSSTPRPPSITGTQTLSDNVYQLLLLVKRGVINTSSLALRLGCDHQYLLTLIADLKKLGLMNTHSRLTTAGVNALKRHIVREPIYKWNRDLYIPTQWRVDQLPIQQPQPNHSRGR